MTIVAFLSAKHSPGVSTLAVTLSALASDTTPALLVEADPCGGDLAARAGLRLEPGLATLAGAARRGIDPGVLEQHLQTLASGAQALVAPTSLEHTVSALRALGPRLPRACEETGRYVFVDLGRWRSDHPAGEMLHAASSVVMLIAPTVEGVEHARSRLAAIAVDPARITVVAVGDRPYGTAEIARALGMPVRAVEFDRRSAEMMGAGCNLDRWMRRTPLVRSARALLDHLYAHVETNVLEMAK